MHHLRYLQACLGSLPSRPPDVARVADGFQHSKQGGLSYPLRGRKGLISDRRGYIRERYLARQVDGDCCHEKEEEEEQGDTRLPKAPVHRYFCSFFEDDVLHETDKNSNRHHPRACARVCDSCV